MIRLDCAYKRVTSNTSMKILQLINLLSIVTLVSCDRNMPGGFWETFDKKSIVKNESDQGPYGGHRVIHWENATKGTYNQKSIIDFAVLNGWTPTDTLILGKPDMIDWISYDKLVFPIYLSGINKKWTEDDLGGYTEFERYIDSDLTVYKFKTDWVLIYPGTDESTSENGYIIVDKDESKMTLYQLWGE